MHATLPPRGVHAGCFVFAGGLGLALSAQAGEGRLSKILKAAGFSRGAAGGGDAV